MIANFGNMFGPDMVIVLLIGLGLPVVGVVLLVRFLAKAKTSNPEPQQNSPSIPERSRRLETLKDQKLISPAEYEKQRASIISHL